MKTCEHCGKAYYEKNDFMGCCSVDCWWNKIAKQEAL